MLRPSVLLLSLLGLAAICSGQADPEVQFEGSLVAPVYEGGYVLAWDSADKKNVLLYGPDAKALYSAPRRPTSELWQSVYAVDADGVSARAYNIRQNQGKGPIEGQIDLLDGSGKIERTINTGSYDPQHLTFAPDHTIWAVGFVYSYEERGEDFNVFRHYARSGEKLGEAVPWSTIAGDINAYSALSMLIGGRRLFTAGDRIGFSSSANYGRAKWIEVSFSGTLLGQYDLGDYVESHFVPGAMTSSGKVYGLIREGNRSVGYGILDKSEHTWRKITGYPSGGLIGADGDSLVFSQRHGGWTVLHKADAAALTLKKDDKPAVADASLRD